MFEVISGSLFGTKQGNIQNIKFSAMKKHICSFFGNHLFESVDWHAFTSRNKQCYGNLCELELFLLKGIIQLYGNGPLALESPLN